MKKNLEHLPERKREEIASIAEFIRKQTRYAEMIILFGSFARGDWVEDTYVEDNITYEYMSDYDFLVVTENKKVTERAVTWEDIARKARKLPIRNHITIIAHTANYINAQLEKAQYFFSDIIKDGVLLYDSGNLKLAPAKDPKELDPKIRLKEAKEGFETFFEIANQFYDQFEYGFKKEHYKVAAFQLHQAAENYYKTVIMVFTLYKPKGHYLDKLGAMAASYDPKFVTVFPQQDEFQKECFDLLNRAYVEARYDKDYKISKKQLEYLAERVKKLRELTEKICKEKIKTFI